MAKDNIPDDINLPQSQAFASGDRVLILTADDVEDLEFFYPYYRFIEEGFAVDVATPKGEAFKGKHGLKLSQSRKISDIDVQDYDVFYIPGGKAPAKLRKDNEAIAITREFVESGRPVISICHGPQLLAAANVINGRKIAAWPEIEEEVSEAGGIFIDEETVEDGQFLTARYPADLPRLMAKTFELLNLAPQTVSSRPDVTRASY